MIRASFPQFGRTIPRSRSLVGWWPFHEGSGGTVSDFSGRRNHGTFAGGTPAWAGRTGWAMDFDGADDVVTCSSDASIDNIFTGGGTITARIYVHTFGENNFGRIAAKNLATFTGGWDWGLNNSTRTNAMFFIHSWNTAAIRWDTPANSISTNTVHHVAVTYDKGSTSNDPSIFIDGVSQSLTESVAPSGTADSDAARTLAIGNTAATDRAFDGLIWDVQAYDRMLTAQEIKRIAARMLTPAADLYPFSAVAANAGAGAGILPFVHHHRQQMGMI